MIKVIIADDHPIVRKGLIQVLEEDPNVEVIGEAENGVEAMDLVRGKNPHVVLMDISMPGMSGLEATERLREEMNEPPPILILSIYPADLYGIRAFKSGASGYLVKSEAPGNLVEAVKKVASGKKYITPTLAELLVDEMDGDKSTPPHTQLSNRELQVMRQLADGKSVSEIAHDLNLSPKTVSTYRARVLEKMKLKNNVEMARYAAEFKLF